MGIFYKNTLFNFNISLPLVIIADKDAPITFDIVLKYCTCKYYFESNFEYYNNFYHNDKSVNMKIFSGGLFAEYVFNNKNHSLDSVYELTSYQIKSSGSVLIGADAFFSYVKSNVTDYRVEKNSFIIFGLNTGYSYIFVFKYGWFCNAMAVASPDLAIDYENGNVYFSPQIRPKLTFGLHRKSWSMNIVFESNFSFVIKSVETIEALETADIGFTLSKRF